MAYIVCAGKTIIAIEVVFESEERKEEALADLLPLLRFVESVRILELRTN